MLTAYFHIGKQKVQSKLNTAGDKNDKTEALLCWVHHEKAGFVGKDNNAGKAEGSRKRGRPNTRWVDSKKEAVVMSPWDLRRL